VSAKGNSNPALPGLSDTAVVKMMPERRESGQGQYFMLRSKARDGRQASDAALADAAERTDQAWKLKNQAAALSGSGGHEAEVARLSTLSTALFSQADSLRIVAQGLAGSAANYDGQAAAYLAGIPPEQARALKAMEGPGSAPAPLETAPAISIPEDQAIAEPPVPDAEQTRTSDQEAPEETAAPVVPEVEAESPTVGPVPSPVAVVTAPSPLRPSTSFAVGPDVAPRQAAIPMDVAMPKGLVYMVQVGAFRNELPAEVFQDITPVSGIHVGNGLVRYSAGRFEDRQEAVKAQDQIRARGYKDAFVVAYMDGQRITLKQAEDAQGTGAVATVSPATPVAKSAVTITRNNGGGTAVLADYPSSAQAVLADFHPMPATDNYYNDPKAAPAKQVETVKGLFFTVQVGVYSRPTALDRLFNITPLNTERTANDKIRYTTGIYRDLASASTRKNTTVALGVTDAFVTAYLNGKRIPLGDARALLAKLGPSVLVDPQLATPQ
jgi:cell division protein FtsN